MSVGESVSDTLVRAELLKTVLYGKRLNQIHIFNVLHSGGQIGGQLVGRIFNCLSQLAAKNSRFLKTFHKDKQTDTLKLCSSFETKIKIKKNIIKKVLRIDEVSFTMQIFNFE